VSAASVGSSSEKHRPGAALSICVIAPCGQPPKAASSAALCVPMRESAGV
jgi:hypothetical protein